MVSQRLHDIEIESFPCPPIVEFECIQQRKHSFFDFLGVVHGHFAVSLLTFEFTGPARLFAQVR